MSKKINEDFIKANTKVLEEIRQTDMGYITQETSSFTIPDIIKDNIPIMRMLTHKQLKKYCNMKSNTVTAIRHIFGILETFRGKSKKLKDLKVTPSTLPFNKKTNSTRGKRASLDSAFYASLGKKKDKDLGEEYGISRTHVGAIRKEMGIPSFKKQSRNNVLNTLNSAPKQDDMFTYQTLQSLFAEKNSQISTPELNKKELITPSAKDMELLRQFRIGDKQIGFFKGNSKDIIYKQIITPKGECIIAIPIKEVDTEIATLSNNIGM